MAVPGWYPDEQAGSGYRYWDGRQWTEHRSPTLPGSEPPPVGEPASTAAPEPTPVPQVVYVETGGPFSRLIDALRDSRAWLIVLGVALAAGGLVAIYLTVIKSDQVCYSESGSEVDCDQGGALTKAEYDEQQAAAAEARAVADKCEAQIGHLLKDARALDSRLDVGLTYDEYSRQVGNISVAYGEIPARDLDLECGTDVAIHLEEALNSYAKAGDLWSNCITDFSCTMASIDPQLQKYWLSAASNIDVAERGLEHLAEPGATQDQAVDVDT